MKDFSDIQVGDTVWLQDNSPRYRGTPARDLQEVQVYKVGRDYFYTKDGWRERKFHKDSGREFVGPNDNGAYSWNAWRFKEEYECHVEEAKDRSKMESFFREHYKARQLSHDQVKAILSIIEP